MAISEHCVLQKKKTQARFRIAKFYAETLGMKIYHDVNPFTQIISCRSYNFYVL